jgi:peptide/nickel transport system substrate-binding protein
MPRATRLGLLMLALAVVACTAPSGSGRQSAGPGSEPARIGPKRITIAILTEPPALHYNLIPNPIRASPGSIQELIHPGLSVFDNGGALRPILSEAVPSVENGLWKVLPDGTMETTWRIRDGAMWHDGTPVTSADLEFTVALTRDRELAVFRDAETDAIESAEAPDERTIVVRWKRPVVKADNLFAFNKALPVPRHILGRVYAENRAAFGEHPYWSHEFVGTGPFKLQEWVRGSHLVLAANDSYVLGRPKLDEVEVRFIGDGNTLVSNILAGTVDLTMSQSLSVDQALHVRGQWADGKVATSADGWSVVYPQSLGANPQIISNVQFKKALLHAIDRQALADNLMAGLLPIAETPLFPDTPEYQAIAASIVHYAYDPQRSIQMIEGLGYARGADGAFRDATGQKLSFETRTTAQRDLHLKTMLPVVDAWQRLGLEIETQVIPAARATDREEQATFPGFQVLRQPAGVDRLVRYHSNEARTAERNFTGNNNGRYMNPDLDRLIDRLNVTLAFNDRMVVASQIIQHLTDQLPVLSLFFDATPTLVHNRMRNVMPLSGHEDARVGWNSQEWDVQ